MRAREKERAESLLRVQAFCVGHPLAPPASYGPARDRLDKIIERVTGHGNIQAVNSRFRKAASSEHNELRRELREEHLIPIARIARAVLPNKPAIDKALSVPGTTLATTKLLADARAFRKVASAHESTFVKYRRPADFLSKLDALIAAVQKSFTGRSRLVSERKGATRALPTDLRKGRDQVNLLDIIVKAEFKGNGKVLGDWESAKKVHDSRARKNAPELGSEGQPPAAGG